MGFGMAPMRDGKVVPPAEFNAWPEAEQQAERATPSRSWKRTWRRRCARSRGWRRNSATRCATLDRETARVRAGAAVRAAARREFADLPAVLAAYRGDARRPAGERAALHRRRGSGAGSTAGRRCGPAGRSIAMRSTCWSRRRTMPPARRWSRSCTRRWPTWSGRIEYLQMQGALVTNFRLIKAGALHRANGGTILLDARSLLTEPFSWAGAEARAAAPGDHHRGRRPLHRPDHDGLAGTRPDPARRQGRAVRRPDAVLPAGRARSRIRPALQGAGGFRRRHRPLPGERGDAGAADRRDRGAARSCGRSIAAASAGRSSTRHGSPTMPAS